MWDSHKHTHTSRIIYLPATSTSFRAADEVLASADKEFKILQTYS